MKISMGQITTLMTSMEDCVKAYEKAGFTRVELAVPTVQRYLKDHSAEDMKALFDEHHIQAVSAIGLSPEGVAALYSRGDQIETYFKSFEEQLKVCKIMGCDLINIGSEDDMFKYDGYEKQAIKNLIRAAELGEKYGLKVAFEDSRMDRCLPLIYEANVNNLGFCVDFFWFFKRGYDIPHFKIFNYDKLFNIHMCDIPKVYNVDSMTDAIRVLPGDGGIPLIDWMKWLSAKGYDGYCTLELLNWDIWAMNIDAACEKCMEAMKPFESI